METHTHIPPESKADPFPLAGSPWFGFTLPNSIGYWCLIYWFVEQFSNNWWQLTQNSTSVALIKAFRSAFTGATFVATNPQIMQITFEFTSKVAKCQYSQPRNWDLFCCHSLKSSLRLPKKKRSHDSSSRDGNWEEHRLMIPVWHLVC